MQKEKLSALMDGETLDNELLASLSKDADLQHSWESYHLIRDTLRGDIGEVLHFDISARVAAAIENEPARKVTSLIPEAQPEPARYEKMPFWRRGGSWAAQLTQVGVAACVSLAVIVGVQHYNSSPTGSATEASDSPAFNTLPMMGKAS
ncbi:RseA family anti-sigma factor, partial [Pantoea endophytica]